MKRRPPLPVQRAMKKLGSDIRDARRRRRVTVELMAERAGISKATYQKIERGEMTVAIGHYAMVLFVFKMTERLSDLADVAHDEIGLFSEAERLPERVRHARPKQSDSSRPS